MNTLIVQIPDPNPLEENNYSTKRKTRKKKKRKKTDRTGIRTWYLKYIKITANYNTHTVITDRLLYPSHVTRGEE